MTGKAWRTLVGAILACLCTSVQAVPKSVRVEVEPTEITADRTLELRLILEGQEVSKVGTPPLSKLKDWRVMAGPSISSQFRFVNGESSTSRSFTWVLAPPGPGTYIIPAMEVEIAGEMMASDPVEVTVLPASSPSSRRGGSEDGGRGTLDPADQFFFRTVLDPPDPYVGQQVLLSYELFTLVDIASVPQAQEAPSYPNFWKEEFDGPKRIAPRIEDVDGESYRVFTVRKVALFPTASGQTVLPPLTFSVPVKMGDSSRFRRSFFFEPVETVYKRAPAVSVDVRPLPTTGRPDDFSNAVGRFELSIEAEPAEARTGEAIGLRVDIEGRGNLSSISEPNLVANPDFTVYPPETRQSWRPDAEDHFGGEKVWKYVLVAREPGRLDLPEVRFSYFDPVDEHYKTLSGGRHIVQVTGAPLADGSGTLAPERRAIEALARDIHFIKTADTDLSRPGVQVYRSAWFWFALFIPPLANLFALGYRWQRRRSHANSVASRRRRAGRGALRLLRKAEAMVAKNGDPRLFGLIAQAMTEYVADRFGAQATGLTYDRIAAMLARDPRTEEAGRRFLETLEKADCGRFVPQTGDSGTRQALLADARQAVLALEEVS